MQFNNYVPLLPFVRLLSLNVSVSAENKNNLREFVKVLRVVKISLMFIEEFVKSQTTKSFSARMEILSFYSSLFKSSFVLLITSKAQIFKRTF